MDSILGMLGIIFSLAAIFQLIAMVVNLFRLRLSAAKDNFFCFIGCLIIAGALGGVTSPWVHRF